MTTVSVYLRRATLGGLGWPPPLKLDDAALEARLFPLPPRVHDPVQPDCAYIHRELKRGPRNQTLVAVRIELGPETRQVRLGSRVPRRAA